MRPASPGGMKVKFHDKGPGTGLVKTRLELVLCLVS